MIRGYPKSILLNLVENSDKRENREALVTVAFNDYYHEIRSRFQNFGTTTDISHDAFVNVIIRMLERKGFAFSDDFMKGITVENVEKRFRFLLFSSVKKEIISLRRSEQARKERESETAKTPSARPKETDEEFGVSGLWFSRVSEKAKLTTQEKIALSLRLEGLSNAEIGKILNSSYAVVATRMSRALKKIRGSLLPKKKLED